VKIGRNVVQGKPELKVNKTLSQPIAGNSGCQDPHLNGNMWALWHILVILSMRGGTNRRIIVQVGKDLCKKIWGHGLSGRAPAG
jgi:CheY-specific phosphatase CheX